MVEHVNIYLTRSLITMHNLVFVSHTVCTHRSRRSQNFGGTLGPCPLGTGHG